MNKLILTLSLCLCLKILISCEDSSTSQKGMILTDEPSYAVADKKRLWNRNNKSGSPITLDILLQSGSAESQHLVERFAVEWTEYANINFRFHRDHSRTKRFDIAVNIHEVDDANGRGGTSFIGTDSKMMADRGHSTMHLYFTPSTDTASKKSYILHEFGHALGLVHEHQHPERGFTFDQEEILRYCSEQGWSEKDCYEHKINTFSYQDYDIFSYDSKSIMHYQMHDIYIGQSTDKEIFKYVRNLSLGDKLSIAKIYPGRISQKDILSKHQDLLKYIEETNDFKACNIEEYNNEGEDLQYYYKLKSETVWGTHFSIFPEKYDTIINMINDPKCQAEQAESEEESFESAFGTFKVIRGNDGF